ncbi:MAG: 3,4-dihydroxy-2-butanone-4-phosphate synthase, partial [Deltaproteobacteria bacterium]|nr:3,4-dihydroxy-2-butanone-4-phosphate synthase [Deltaproteobacteria bacterium]
MAGATDETKQAAEEIHERIVSTERALEEFRAGRPIILVDDEDRENEGDIALPAQFVTTELVNFMVAEARGLVCAPMTEERADQLNLPLMTEHSTAPL